MTDMNLTSFAEMAMPPFVGAFDDEMEKFREAAQAYRRACLLRPGINRCTIARDVASRIFRISVVELRSMRRAMPLAEQRTKLMAFCRVVSVESHAPNSWTGIGRAFNRNHATVIAAAHRHGDRIARALGVTAPIF